MATRYGIWTSVSGGVTGPRSAWMKDIDGRVWTAQTREAAQHMAAHFEAGRTDAARARFHQTYEVRPVEVPEPDRVDLPDEEDDQWDA